MPARQRSSTMMKSASSSGLGFLLRFGRPRRAACHQEVEASACRPDPDRSPEASAPMKTVALPMRTVAPDCGNASDTEACSEAWSEAWSDDCSDSISRCADFRTDFRPNIREFFRQLPRQILRHLLSHRLRGIALFLLGQAGRFAEEKVTKMVAIRI